jgi:hypothetical protein
LEHAEHVDGGGASQRQHDAFDLRPRLAELEQQPGMQARGLQTIQALRAMQRANRPGLLRFDKQINSLFPDHDPVVPNDQLQ